MEDTAKAASEKSATIAPFLKVLEGGRAIAANEVLAEFASKTADISTEVETMAGFAVMAWDDEGNLVTEVHIGGRTPFSPMLVPAFARDLFKADIVDQGAVD